MFCGLACARQSKEILSKCNNLATRPLQGTDYNRFLAFCGQRFDN
jgi:hypothetical protein